MERHVITLPRTAAALVPFLLLILAACGQAPSSGSSSAGTSSPAAPSATAACTIVTDRAPAVSETFYVTGTGFKPNVDLEITVDAGTPAEEKLGPAPGSHTSATGTMGRLDLTYTSPSDAGPHSIAASDGSCTAKLEFTVPSPFTASPS